MHIRPLTTMRTGPRSVSIIAAICLLIIVPIVASAHGCASGPKEAPKSDTPYQGPSLDFESTGAQHRIIMTAPSSGWSVTLDRTTPRLEHTDVFITIVGPNPAFRHAQALVTQEVGSGIEITRPIEVYARVLEFGEPAADQPFHPAGRAAVPASPAPP